MDTITKSGSLNTTVSSKKLPFSSAERELIVALVRDRPVIEDKRTHAKNIELKRRAWEDLTVAYNSQPYVSQRLTHQLKRCWENIKTQRKKELLQESLSLKRTGGGPPDCSSVVSDNVVDTICPFINLRVPGVIDSNTIEMLVDTHNPSGIVLENDENSNNNSRKITSLENESAENISYQPKFYDNNESFSTPTSKKKKLVTEMETRVKRTAVNIRQDQELHELRIKREKILIERETNLLEFEKKIQDLQTRKLHLEIELLSNEIKNKTS